MKSSSASAAHLILHLLLLISSRAVVKGQAVATQACGTTFFSALVQLMPCRPAVAPFSPAPPSELCCNAVRNLGQPCLCAIANGPPISGVDRTGALELPAKCSVNYEQCSSVRSIKKLN